MFVPSTQRITLYAVILERAHRQPKAVPNRISPQKVRFFQITIRALLPSFCFAKIHLPPGGRLGGGANADKARCGIVNFTRAINRQNLLYAPTNGEVV